MSTRSKIRDEFEVTLLVCLAFLAGFMIGRAERKPAPAVRIIDSFNQLPTPAAESAGDQPEKSRAQDRSVFSARRGNPHLPLAGFNPPAGARSLGGRIESASAVVLVGRPAAGRGSNFRTVVRD